MEKPKSIGACFQLRDNWSHATEGYIASDMDAFLEEQAEKVKELILLLDEYPSVEQQAKEEQLAKEILFALRGKAKEKSVREKEARRNEG